jgi:hypothetical protein
MYRDLFESSAPVRGSFLTSDGIMCCFGLKQRVLVSLDVSDRIQKLPRNPFPFKVWYTETLTGRGGMAKTTAKSLSFQSLVQNYREIPFLSKFGTQRDLHTNVRLSRTGPMFFDMKHQGEIFFPPAESICPDLLRSTWHPSFAVYETIR